MALTSYAALQQTIAGYINRSDLSTVPAGNTTTPIQDAIALAEADIRLKVWRNTVRNTAFLIGNGDQTTDQFQLPSDCAALRSVRLVSGLPNLDYSLRVCTPEELADFRSIHYGVAARPRYCSILTGNNLVVAPVPDQIYNSDIWYWQELVPLSSTNTTNPILAEFPNLYLWGALKELAPFLEHDERIPVWAGKYDELLDDIHARRDREEYGGPLPALRLPVWF